MTGGIRVYVSGALVFAIAFVICVRALGSTAAPFDSCDRAGVVDEGARTFDGDLCAGDDPNDTVMTLKAATIAADVLCRNSNWKQVPLHSDAWETMGWSECGQAPEGGTPICEAMFSAAFYYGVENGKHVFKRVVESARWDGNGCVWEAGDRVTLEHKEWSAPGCCTSGCQDEQACESDESRIYRASGCTCDTRQCDEPEQCNSPLGPCTVDERWDEECECCKPLESPILIVVSDSSLQFVSPFDGPVFDLFANGRAARFSWPSTTDENVYWLALDRNGNGRIDDGSELFGTRTRLATGKRAKHGYMALAEFDENGDARIDATDQIYRRLVLWQRLLPAGSAQLADQIQPLARFVSSISLTVEDLQRRDRWGNLFRYRARVVLRSGHERWSYDVFPQPERTAASVVQRGAAR